YLELHPDSMHGLGTLRVCTAGGDVVPLDLHHRFRRVTGLDITELFGMTEVLSCITNPPFGTKKLGAIGRPVAQTGGRVAGGAGRASGGGGRANFSPGTPP